jgi:hypothetical protein
MKKVEKVCVFALVFFLFGLTVYFGQAGIQTRKEKGEHAPVMAAPNFNNEGKRET